jgi:hypothetical protein
VTGHSNEPAILDRVTLETLSGAEWLPHHATIANLTPREVWLGLDEQLGELVEPLRKVRIATPQSAELGPPAETVVERHIGTDGRVIVLVRPDSWGIPSRRANSRVNLAIPAYLRPGDDLAPVPARTTNIGVGGFHCLSDIPIAVGHTLPVTLMLTPLDPFDCQAQVVRLDDNPDDPSGRHMVVAFRFLDLTEQDEATIAEALIALADDLESEAVPQAWRSAAAE